MIFIATDFKASLDSNMVYLAPKAYSIFKRYAMILGEVCLCSRVESINKSNSRYEQASYVTNLIAVRGYKELLLHKYDKQINDYILQSELVIVRLPSIIGFYVASIARKYNKPILTEAMGDAWDSYWNHGVSGKVLAPIMSLEMKRWMKSSNYAIYVTNEYLQRRFPTRAPSIAASNVSITTTSKDILGKRLDKIRHFDRNKFSIATLGGVDVIAKGHRYVMKAIAELNKKNNIEIDYYIIGGGNQTRLKKLAKDLKISDYIFFTGELTMSEVFEKLDEIDIYVQPSLQEGLPRSVIEAMSRGCPTIGSRTAGTPELISEECIFNRASHKAIIDKILWFREQNLEFYAQKNFEESLKYSDEIISDRRNRFLRYIKKDLQAIQTPQHHNK